MIIVLMGPPGSGKGTQGERLAAKLGLPKVATGDALRTALKAGTPLGLEAKSYMDRGDLVPDRVILGIMKEALGSAEAKPGAILDGVVRTEAQAEGLMRLLAELKRPLDHVLVFDVADDELVTRLSGRTTCDVCQAPYTGREPGSACPKQDGGKLVRRVDDEPASVLNRLVVYRKQTKPVIDWFERNKANVVYVNAVGALEEVQARALKALGAK